MKRKFLPVFLPLALLGGCASQSARENLRQCQWELADLKMDTVTAQVYRGTATVKLHNITGSEAILDSLWVDISMPSGPLGRLSHAGTLNLPAGATKTADIHFSAVPAQIGVRMAELLFAMPDSFTVRGEARVPLMGGLFHKTQAFRTKIPGSLIGNVLETNISGGASDSTGGGDTLPEDENDEDLDGPQGL